MARGDEHYRLALSVFAEPEDLWRIVGLLLDAGVSIERVCLVASADAMARLTPTLPMVDGQFDQMTALHRRLKDWPGSPDGEQVVTTSAPLLQVVLNAQARGAGAANRAVTTSSSKPDLLRQIRGGLVALIVRSPDASQQLLATQTLLQNAKHRVSTFELMVPDADSQTQRE